MFRLTLLQTNGSRRGSRHIIDRSPYLIGRNEQCDLTFASRSVSRKHCKITFNDTDVLIQDLGSRNGTVVEGELIETGVPKPLSHHDHLKIGKYTFRVSIRDQATGKPFRFKPTDLSTLSGPPVVPADTSKGAAQLLVELDELASDLGRSQGSASPLLRRFAATDEPEIKADPVKADESEQDDQTSSTTSIQVADGGVPSTDRLDVSADDTESASPESRKIPDHLRPKRPKDSQSAASAALRNLFIR
ncbi:FHA domain-containing protein [Planctomycetes bacterium TBK1r]|uniref:Glycogen accumulation regulator GarA n=1 Tax=Stieleria magnilauensis TaxID=2527963 RepID=A0ABX5XYE3_9BACT|nr:Glycogen accumulation regulator GarA [Planctomycetes bacterium TBK1r]